MKAIPKRDGRRIKASPTVDINCGDVVFIGGPTCGVVGVATAPIAANSVGYIQLGPGEYEVELDAPTSAAAGDALRGAAKTLAGGTMNNVFFGPLLESTTTGDATARALLVSEKTDAAGVAANVAPLLGETLVGVLDSTGGTASTAATLVAPASSAYTAAELEANFATLAAAINAIVDRFGGTIPSSASPASPPESNGLTL